MLTVKQVHALILGKMAEDQANQNIENSKYLNADSKISEVSSINNIVDYKSSDFQSAEIHSYLILLNLKFRGR